MIAAGQRQTRIVEGIKRALQDVDGQDLTTVAAVVNAARLRSLLRRYAAKGGANAYEVALLDILACDEDESTDSPECDAPGPLLTGAHRTEPAGSPGALEQSSAVPAAISEADQAELIAHELDFEAVTTLAVAEEFGAVQSEPVPGERVEVTEAVGSRTGPRYAIGRFVGWERNERTGERMQLVEVHGVVGRFAAVRRVG